MIELGQLAACTLCPRQCGVDRTAGQKGFCGAGRLTRVARAAPHFWEEPCISGQRGAGTIFLSHCTLGCIYCQNGAISRDGQGVEVSEERLTALFLSLEQQGVHNLEWVTPTHYIPQLCQALVLARERGFSLPVVYNCGGYERVDTVAALADTVDVWMPDFKYSDEKYGRLYSGISNYTQITLAAIDEMLRHTGAPRYDEQGLMTRGVLVRHLLLPGLLPDSLRVVKTLWERYGDDIVLSLMSQYTPMPGVPFASLTRRVNPRHYEALVDFAAELGIIHCYTQDPNAATIAFIPDFGASLIE